jgi:hypothetical protein
VEKTKRFLLDEMATAEATSTVVMIAAVGLVLAGGLLAYYTGLNGFFNTVGTGAEGAGSFQWFGS